MEIIDPYVLKIEDRSGGKYELRAMKDLRGLLSRGCSSMTFPVLLTDTFGSKYIGTAEHALGFDDGGSPFRMEHALPDGSLDYLTKDSNIFSMFHTIFDQGNSFNAYVGIRWVKRSVTTGQIERIGIEYSNPAHSMRSEHSGLAVAPGDWVLIDLCFVLVR